MLKMIDTTLIVGGKLRRKKLKQRASNPVIPNYQPRSEKKVEEVTLTFEPCCLCGEPIKQGYYGRYGNGGTCSKTCEKEMAAKPRDFGEPK